MKFLNNIEVGATPNFTLPLSDGSNGQVLQTDGSGTVSWGTISGGANDYVTAAAFNTTTGVVTLTVQNQTAVTVNLDGRYLTAHPNITAASSVNNSGNTYIQDVTLDSNGHVTGLVSASVSGFGTMSEFTVSDGTTSNPVNDGDTLSFRAGANVTVSNNGSSEITIAATDTNTTYSAGAGLDLTGTVFSLESDLRGDVEYVGNSANDYIQFDAVSGTQMQFYVNGAIAGAWRNDGAPELHCDGDIIGYSSTISDARLKEDVETIESASEKVSQLRGVEYTWKKGSRKGQREIGLIAQEVEAVIPSIVREKELVAMSGLDDSSTSYKTVDYEKLIALLIESNKEQQEIISQLEERVIDLETRL